jgi:purine-binding chemotaxis protein CheW
MAESKGVGVGVGIVGLNDNTMQDKFLTFLLGNESYAIPIQYILEIVGIQKITIVPDMVSYIKGVINLRGQVIPVVDVRLRFGMTGKDYDERTCIMITRIGDVSVGLIVDTVEEVRDITPDLIGASPRIATAQSADFIQGIARIGEEVVIVLDVSKLLYANDLATAASASAAE